MNPAPSLGAITAIVLSCTILWSTAAGQGIRYHSVLYDVSSKHFSLVSGRSPDAIAWGYYQRDGNQTGWNKLYVRAQSPSLSTAVVGKAAGFLEGALTHADIRYSTLTYDLNFQSFWKHFPKVKDAMQAWLKDWVSWVEQQVNTHPADEYWEHVGMILAQASGLAEGYNLMQSSVTTHRTAFEMLQFSSGADMMDVMQSLLSESERTPWLNMTPQEAQLASALNSHCSALIKPLIASTLPGSRGWASLEDVLVGHTTWNQYIGMLRIFKQYDIRMHPNRPASMSFSSYPAFLFSGDDYYLMSDTSLVSMETTLDVYNNSLYSLLSPKSVLTWVRGMVANRLASNGSQWVDVFSRYNSGTYNNQWMVVDYDQLSSNSDLLWVAEQMPGHVAVGDLTRVLLKQGYWPSYNIPYFTRVYDAMGYKAMAEKFGDPYTYDHAPRANIFRRNSTMVHSMADLQAMMRYNNYLHDPLSLGNPGYAVASRFDLTIPTNQSSPVGGIDSKVTDRMLTRREAAYAISGPTDRDVPMFDWTKDNQWGTPHVGQPLKFHFSWEMIEFVH